MYCNWVSDFLRSIAEHYADLQAFVRAFLRERKAVADFLRRAAPGLREGCPAVSFPAWARRRLSVALKRESDPLRRPVTLAAISAAFGRRGPPCPETLDRAIQGLSQDAQPALTARYENDLPLATLAWRFRTTEEHAFGAISRVRRLLIKAVRGAAPEPRLDELVQKHLEGVLDAAEELAAAVIRDPAAADAFADAARLDAALSAYFGGEVDEGASLVLTLAERTTSPRSSPARRPGRARSRT